MRFFKKNKLFLLLVTILIIIQHQGSTNFIVVEDVDPSSLTLSSHFFADFTISIDDVKIDSKSNVILTGSTVQEINRDANFQTINQLFISKFTLDGIWIWTQFYHIEDLDTDFALAIDKDDNILIGGLISNRSSLTLGEANSFDTDLTGQSSGFLMKISGENGGTIFWSTYLEDNSCSIDSEKSYVDGIDVDSNNNYVVALINQCPGFPTTDDSVLKGESDVAIMKFDSIGNLIWSTLYGGSDIDIVEDLELRIDSSDNIFITSSTLSVDLPNKLNNSYIPLSNNGDAGDGYLAKFNSDGKNIYSKYIGGSSTDVLNSLAIGSNDQIAVAGWTSSNDFPNVNAFQSNHAQFELGSSLVKRDGVVTLMHNNGSTYLSSFLGGSDRDQVLSVDFNLDGNVVLGGVTFSNDFKLLNPTDDKIESNNPTDTFQDSFVTSFDENGEFVFSTYLGGNEKEERPLVRYDDTGNIIAAGSTESSDFEKMGAPYDYEYPNQRINGYLVKYSSSGEIQWSTVSTVATDPRGDDDEDGLANEIEFKLNSDAENADTDGDGITDGWELTHQLNFKIDDSKSDPDEDGLNNLEEFEANTNPYSSDTDGDNIPDLYEVKNNLDPTIYDSDKDLDNDGITNLDEYLLGFNPMKKDTDSDGMDDGWELRNGLNATYDDSNQDPDGDGVKNYWEYNLGLDPHDSNLPEIIIIGMVLILIPITISLLYIKKRNSAKSQGFNGVWHQFKSKGKGFSSIHELNSARKAGFHSISMRNIVNTAGYTKIGQLKDAWEILISKINSAGERDFELIKENVINSTSSKDRSINIEIANNAISNLRSDKSELLPNLSLSQTLLETGNQIDKNITGISVTEVEMYQHKFNNYLVIIDKELIELEGLVKERMDWFAPWDQLLSLIEISKDGSPIKMSLISKTVNLEINHAETLLQLLLKEYETIGSYDPNSQIFTKGINIASYVNLAKRIATEGLE
ncbi:MAG: hypothetical protein GPJ54_18930 [Candidatus Heimdallarchaeota archaeon]|nr:hypothetical protein [Candidatus Heimdallarchaeota archaeon]